MIDLRPVTSVIGMLALVYGAAMLIPFGLDLADGNGEWHVFARASGVTMLVGGLMSLASRNSLTGGLTLQQTFLLTTGVWVILPLFGTLPFLLGATEASLVDAMFEAVSGLTTTGATVFSGLDDLPRGLLLWRSMTQWFGGIGIIIVAMAFLPTLRVGGMQIFRSEAFDTFGKILPRAAELASQIFTIYAGLTLTCLLAYLALGMSGFDAINHALTTMSTGGFSTHDASFGTFPGAPEYVASVFMVLASLPFVRYVQLVAGTAKPLFRDAQIRAFVTMIVVVGVMLGVFQVVVDGRGFEESTREAIFNITSIASGTGFASVDYQLWGAFPVVVFFFIGLVGGCAGSTCCSIKIFRYQILFASVIAVIRKIHSPHGIFTPRFGGRPVTQDVISSVMAFFTVFIVTLGVLSIALSATGLDFVTAVSGAATALANIGPGLGDTIGPSGNFATINTPAKWLMIAAMLIGRLELMVVYVLFTRSFWVR